MIGASVEVLLDPALHRLLVTDGEDCIIVPAVPDDDVPAKFPKGSTTIKPYLRYTPQPNK